MAPQPREGKPGAGAGAPKAKGRSKAAVANATGINKQPVSTKKAAARPPTGAPVAAGLMALPHNKPAPAAKMALSADQLHLDPSLRSAAAESSVSMAQVSSIRAFSRLLARCFDAR